MASQSQTRLNDLIELNCITKLPPGNLSLDFQKAAIDLKSAGTLAHSRGWFSEPAPSLPELPWALQGVGHTRSPQSVGGWCRSSTQGTEGARGPRREVPGCSAPRSFSVNRLWGAVTFTPFAVFISLFTKTLPQNPSSPSSWGSPLRSLVLLERNICLQGCLAEIGQLFLW